VGASPGPAGDHPITFCYLLLDRDLGVGEGTMVEVHDVPVPFGAGREVGEGRVVVDGVWGGDLLCDIEVLRVEDFFKPTREERTRELETERDALLTSYAEVIPEALDNLSGEERMRVYEMLQLEVSPDPEGYEVSGAFCSKRPRGRRR
jgi:hypothetical protein